MEKAAVATGKELGALAGKLEKKSRELAKRSDALQGKARKQTAQWARKASKAFDKLARDLGKAKKR
jgi:uncharacterized protein YukE